MGGTGQEPPSKMTPGQGPGPRNLQMLSYCVVAPNGTFLRELFKLAYDGEDFIYLDKYLQTWTTTHSWAKMTKHRWWKTNFAKFMRHYLTEVCVHQLLKQTPGSREGDAAARRY